MVRAPDRIRPIEFGGAMYRDPKPTALDEMMNRAAMSYMLSPQDDEDTPEWEGGSGMASNTVVPRLTFESAAGTYLNPGLGPMQSPMRKTNDPV